jgi:hypothetical protein
MPQLPSARCLPARLVGFTLLALLLACGGGGGGSSGGGGGGDTGSVAVLLTDGPVDPHEFSHIFVTFTEITLIGDSGHVTIFEGEETIDLRDLEDASTLVTLGRDVPARLYEKIRLDVSEIELVPADGGDSIFPKLPPKLDLNPRGTFRVGPGGLLIVQIDMDAGKSIHVVETGAGGFIFRPVVFVDVLNGPRDGKLVLLRGEVEEIGGNGFLVCDTHKVWKAAGATRTMATTRDTGRRDGDDDRHDRCVDVAVDDDTSLFDASGDPIELDALATGDRPWVLGRFTRDFDDGLDLGAEVVQLGDDVLAVDGEVASEVDADDRFDLELEPGQGIVTDDGLLAIQLQDGSKVFRRTGEPLEPDDIEVGDLARAVGVLALSSSEDDALKAAWVVLDLAAAETSRIEGRIVDVEGGGARIGVETDDGTLCVDVPADARVLAVFHDDDDAGTEEIARSQLAEGDSVSAFGEEGAPCFVADAVIVFKGDEDSDDDDDDDDD